MAKKRKKLSPEKREAWMRIPIFIISGVILEIWGFFIFCISLAQLIMIVTGDKKKKDLQKMCKTYIIQLYSFARYVTFLSDMRPFPFGDLQKEIGKEK